MAHIGFVHPETTETVSLTRSDFIIVVQAIALTAEASIKAQPSEEITKELVAVYTRLFNAGVDRGWITQADAADLSESPSAENNPPA